MAHMEAYWKLVLPTQLQELKEELQQRIATAGAECAAASAKRKKPRTQSEQERKERARLLPAVPHVLFIPAPTSTSAGRRGERAAPQLFVHYELPNARDATIQAQRRQAWEAEGWLEHYDLFHPRAAPMRYKLCAASLCMSGVQCDMWCAQHISPMQQMTVACLAGAQRATPCCWLTQCMTHVTIYSCRHVLLCLWHQQHQAAPPSRWLQARLSVHLFCTSSRLCYHLQLKVFTSRQAQALVMPAINHRTCLRCLRLHRSLTLHQSLRLEVPLRLRQGLRKGPNLCLIAQALERARRLQRPPSIMLLHSRLRMRVDLWQPFWLSPSPSVRTRAMLILRASDRQGLCCLPCYLSREAPVKATYTCSSLQTCVRFAERAHADASELDNFCVQDESHAEAPEVHVQLGSSCKPKSVPERLHIPLLVPESELRVFDSLGNEDPAGWIDRCAKAAAGGCKCVLQRQGCTPVRVLDTTGAILLSVCRFRCVAHHSHFTYTYPSVFAQLQKLGLSIVPDIVPLTTSTVLTRAAYECGLLHIPCLAWPCMHGCTGGEKRRAVCLHHCNALATYA
jgi:hypothetical protein